MHSSTSSSEAAAGNTRSELVRATKVLLVAVLALCVTAEIAARVLVPKMSNTMTRTITQCQMLNEPIASLRCRGALRGL